MAESAARKEQVETRIGGRANCRRNLSGPVASSSLPVSAGLRNISAISLLAALVVALLLPVVASAAPVYSYFPTSLNNDAKMLCISGTNLQTLSGTSVSVSFSVDNTESQFNLGIFDGAANTVWDDAGAAFPTTFVLYADPLGDGTGTTVIDTWTDANMSANSWTDRLQTTSAAARSPSGNYFYRLYVYTPSPANASRNAFKVRVEGYTYIIPTTVFGYRGATPSNQWTLVYPNYPTRTPTTYDGIWDFYFYAPQNSDHINIYDGDFDVTNDTNDPNSSGIPPFDTGYAVNEAALPGSPADDNNVADYLRTPNINYSVLLPDGTTSYANNNPSGNTEWELFRLDTTTSTPSITDYRAPSLPSGMYRMRISGVDMHNLNALRFEQPVVGVDASGRPMLPPAPFLVGDTVFNDIDGDGTQDPGETGIAGVVMTLRDPVSGRIIAAAITDTSGAYVLNTWNGTYEVKAEDSNFYPGGALNGWAATLPSPPTRSVVIANANVMTADFGFRVPPLVGLNVFPDQNGSMAPGQTISYRFTVSNNTASAGTFDLTSASSRSWARQIQTIGGSALSSVSLAAGEATTVVVAISVPSTATVGMQDSTVLTAKLRTNSAVTDSATAVTTVLNGVMIDPNHASDAALSTSVSYTHMVTNSWPTTRTITLSAASSSPWPVSILATDGVTVINSVTVGPNGASLPVIVRVSVPSTATVGASCTTTITATSGGQSDTDTDVTTARNLMTYDDPAGTIPQVDFTVGDSIYGRAGGLTNGQVYRFQWYDSTGTLVRTSGSITAGASGVATDTVPTTVGVSPTGAWRVELRRRTGGNTWTTITATSNFNVHANALITNVWATDAPSINTSISVGSTLYNNAADAMLNGSIRYTIWWDTNGNGTFDSGDLYINTSGAAVTYNGTGAVTTHLSTGVDVAGTAAYTDPPWMMSNSNFPNQGNYKVTATWLDSTGAAVDTKTTDFYSIPTLGWPLFAVAIAGFATVMTRRLRTATAGVRTRE